MFYYSIIIQFAKAEAPKFTDILELIDKAIYVYNAKSLMAANPKQIVEKQLNDEITLEVILESTQELQEAMASKALRVFSSFLIDDETKNNLSKHITGKRLFKMLPSRLENYVPQKLVNLLADVDAEENTSIEEHENAEEHIEGRVVLDELAIIERIIALLKDARSDLISKRYSTRINNMLIEWEKKCSEQNMSRK